MTANDEVIPSFPIRNKVMDNQSKLTGIKPLKKLEIKISIWQKKKFTTQGPYLIMHVTPLSNNDPANDHLLPILFIAT